MKHCGVNNPEPAGQWIERFEEWLVDSGFLKKPPTNAALRFQIGISKREKPFARSSRRRSLQLQRLTCAVCETTKGIRVKVKAREGRASGRESTSER